MDNKKEEGYCDICDQMAMCTETKDGDFLCDECLEPGSSRIKDRVVSFETCNYLNEDEELNYG